MTLKKSSMREPYPPENVTFEVILAPTERKRSISTSRCNALVGDTRAGWVDFSLEDSHGLVRTTDWYVVPEHRGHELPEAIFDHLEAQFPDRKIAEGGGSNSDDGDRLLARLRAGGRRYHLYECFLGTSGCVCCLGDGTEQGTASPQPRATLQGPDLDT